MHTYTIPVIGLLFTLIACTSSSNPPAGGDAGSGTDSGPGADARPTPVRDAGDICPALGCTVDCEFGQSRDENGCATCACNPAPDRSCTDEGSCVLAVDGAQCCRCFAGFPRALVDAQPCLVERLADAPAGCLPDVCDTALCGACEPVVRATCEAGTCSASSECADGQVQYERTCAPSCTSHADCTLAADYGSCCGSCRATHTALDAADECLAERLSDSSCEPPPGSCDGLGCASPPFDCGDSGSAVCMADGLCREGGAGGACPTGTSDDNGVCVPN